MWPRGRCCMWSGGWSIGLSRWWRSWWCWSCLGRLRGCWGSDGKIALMRECAIGFSINDRPSSVGALIEQMNPVFTSAEAWRVDLSKCQYLGPDAAALIAGSLLLRKWKNQGLEVILPKEPPGLD